MRLVGTVGSAAPPGESSHVVSLLLGGLDEAQKLELGHSLDKTGAGEQAEEQHFFNCGLYSGQNSNLSYTIATPNI